MSRTKRQHKWFSKEPCIPSIPKKKWDEMQFPEHQRKGSLHKGCPTKFRLGPGGINCNCCTPLEPGKLKVSCRRAERRIRKSHDKKDLQDGEI